MVVPIPELPDARRARPSPAVAEAPREKLGAISYTQGPGTTLKQLTKYLRVPLVAASYVAESHCVQPSSCSAQYVSRAITGRPPAIVACYAAIHDSSDPRRL